MSAEKLDAENTTAGLMAGKINKDRHRSRRIHNFDTINHNNVGLHRGNVPRLGKASN